MAKFEYGVASIKDLRVKTEADAVGRPLIRAITLRIAPCGRSRPQTRSDRR